MNTTWSQLHNAQHITDLIELVKQHPKEFSMAYNAAYNAARNAALDAARNAAYKAAYVAACDAAYKAVWDAAYDAALYAALDAVLAFVAYDDSTKYLQMPHDQLRIWAELSRNPAAILLLPYVKARELIKAKT